MITLFFKECRIYFKSILFYIYIFAFFVFFITQFSDVPLLKEPQRSDQNFGRTYSDDPNVIMNMTMSRLLYECGINEYIAYPVGFYKKVKLNEKKQKQVFEIMENITGLSIEEIYRRYYDYWEKTKDMDQKEEDLEEKFFQEEFSFADKSYKVFQEEMQKIDHILGGGSYYQKDRLKQNAYVPMTYEQAKEEYDSIIRDDKVVGAYARLFCDYMGIMLGILPVFLAVFRELWDQKAKAVEVIYSKQISSIKLLLSKYLALLFISFLPVFVFGIVILTQAMFFSGFLGVKGDIGLYFAYLASWLLPTTMFTLSLGMLCSLLTGKAVGILVQAFIWCFCIFSGNIKGEAGWNLVPRFNSFGKYRVFKDMYTEFIVNRTVYTIIVLVLFFVSVIILEWKRSGGGIRWKSAFK